MVSSVTYCQELGLEEVLKKVKENNFTILKQNLSFENSLISTKNSYKSRYLPSINFGAEGEISEVGDEGIGPDSVSMKIDLDVGGQQLNKYRIQKNNLKIAELNKEKTWDSLQLQVISTYFQYLSMNKNIEYVEKTLNVLNSHQRKLEKLLSGGNLIPKNELLKIEIDIEENKIQLLSLKYNHNVLKQRLFTLMGLGLDQDIEFKDIDPSTLMVEHKIWSGDSQEKKPLRGSMNAKINVLEMENNMYEHKIAKAELLPKFYIKPEYRFKDRGYSEKGGRVLVGFNWNFEWGNTLNDIDISTNNVKIAEMSYKEKVANMTLEIRESYEQLKMAKLALEVSNKKIALMRENLKLDTSRFDNRLMGSNEYLDSVNNLKIAEEKLYEQQQQIFLLNLKLKNLIS